jgi:hypothetical protein
MAPAPILTTPMVSAAVLLLQVAVTQSDPDDRARADARAAAPPSTAAVAIRTTEAPVIDGYAREAIWASAHVIDGFRQFDPVEDVDPSHRTEARVAYDDRYLYVFVRAHDSHPDQLLALLSRRDVPTQSDWIHLMVDSYHDRRTGYRFTVNPAGVKRDVYIFNDGNEDLSWDAVWDVATQVDSLGWTAEYRIPLSQLRYPEADEHTFGLAIWRHVGRTNERISWPLYRRQGTGFVSQFGTLSGMRGLTSARRVELMPYVVERNASIPSGGGRFGRTDVLSVGADLKVGLTSNLTVDATINPDFGQVEADPAVLNLSAFEQFFAERRPFFLEGQGIFNFNMNCNNGTCTGLFYSRRVGRAPQLGGVYADRSNPQSTVILGAAKLTGRTANGWNVGLLNAVTRREAGSEGRTIEPLTNYSVARVYRDLRGGNSGVGLMATGVVRATDEWSTDFLRRDAYTVGADWRHRFADNRYAVVGYLVGSRVSGSAESIARTQRSSVHNFQRPDARRLSFDPDATSMSGAAMQVGLEKIAGLVRFHSGAHRYSPGFEPNDAGFLARVDEIGQSNWVGLNVTRPTTLYRRANLNFNQWTAWNHDLLPLARGGNINGSMELANQMHVNAGYGVMAPGTYSDREARGGPAVRRDGGHEGWIGWRGDARHAVIPTINGNFFQVDGGRSAGWGVNTGASYRISSRWQGSVHAGYQDRASDWQWLGNYPVDGRTAYTFAHLDQRVTSVTARLDVTATPTLSFQLYAQPFVTSGDYSDWRELDDPRARDYDARFRPFTAAGEPSDFNVKQFRSNTVARWEYRPGSVLFFVWQQGRDQAGLNPGSFDASRDYGDLFRTRADNTFLIKASYWFNL